MLSVSDAMGAYNASPTQRARLPYSRSSSCGSDQNQHRVSLHVLYEIVETQPHHQMMTG